MKKMFRGAKKDLARGFWSPKAYITKRAAQVKKTAQKTGEERRGWKSTIRGTSGGGGGLPFESSGKKK